MDTEQQLALISKAWGKQKGYVFFPWIKGDAKDKRERIQSYHEGRAYKWPQERPAILKLMADHKDDDLYWCPSIFEKKRRILEYAMDEYCLWADLDRIDPRKLGDLEPTIAWETSPDRYQGLWLIAGGDIQGASWPGNENQKLTHYIGADPSGWDTTQLLRIPGWTNHKPEYRDETGSGPAGNLMWSGRRRYLADDFDDLPDVASQVDVNLALDDEIDAVDRGAVWARVRLKLSTDVRQLFAAKEALGDRSDTLWRLERDLADAGCTVTEIVSLIRETVWNKFAGRQDEIRRLITEASKAVAARPADAKATIEEERELRPKPERIGRLIADATPPEWLIKDIWGRASCGFVAGEPKSYKSWITLDLALSISTGAPFLDRFDIFDPGPVLYIQEEDPLSRVKQRIGKIWPSKKADRLKFEEAIDGGMPKVVWMPPEDMGTIPDPNMAGYIRQGFVASSGEWQGWLDEVLDDGFEGEKYRMVILDPLMMIAGDVDENRSSEMTERLFKPLKQLAEKHQVAICIVHHMGKGNTKGPKLRGGQMMLGSVANHAWTEDALYVRRERKAIAVEVESKNGIGGSFKIFNLRNRTWTPRVGEEDLGAEEDFDDDNDEKAAGREYAPVKQKEKATKTQSPKAEDSAKRGRKGGEKVMQFLDEAGLTTFTTKQVAEGLGIKNAYKQLARMTSEGQLKQTKTGWKIK